MNGRNVYFSSLLGKIFIRSKTILAKSVREGRNSNARALVLYVKKTHKKDMPGLFKRKLSKKKVSKKDKPGKKPASVCDLPDLTISGYATEYVGEDYVINVVVENVGCKKSNPTRVYCNAISLIPHPEVNDIRIQGSAELGEIQSGTTAPCSFTFRLHDLHAKEVGRIEILVDPKHEVAESNEFNNTESFSWPS